MPLAHVLISSDANKQMDHLAVKKFANKLRADVANTLACSERDGDLTADDVEVEVTVRDPKRHFGGDKYDVQVIVFGNDFPSRQANLQERCESLKGQVGQNLPTSVSGYVWILLAPAAFSEF